MDGRRRTLAPIAFRCLLALSLAGLPGFVRAQAPLPAYADSATIFAQVFERDLESTRTLLQLPVLIRNSEVGVVPAEMSSDIQASRLNAEALAELISHQATVQILARVREGAGVDGLISLDALREIGLEAEIDTARLVVRIGIPASLQPIRQFDLRTRRPKTNAEALVSPARTSAYLNIRTGLDYLHESVGGIEAGRQPLLSDFQFAGRFADIVFEADASYDEKRGNSWRRGGVRLVYDDPGKAIRTMFGDLSYPVVGFQSFRPLGGVTVARNFNLQPYRVIEPSGRYEFALNRESRVDVLVNGREVSRIRLAPGRYDLRDFPLSQGQNDVVLRIIDPVGQVRLVEFDALFEEKLLVKGLHEYAYSFGFPSRISGSTLHYDDQSPSFSAFHRYGFSDYITLGGNAQGDGDVQMLGGELIWATPIGSFAIEPAISHVDLGGLGGAAGIGYEWREISERPSLRTVDLRMIYRSRHFASLGNPNPINPTVLDTFFSYGQSLGRDTRISASLNYGLAHDEFEDRWSAQTALSQQFSRNFSLVLRVIYQRDFSGREDVNTFVSLLWRPDRSTQTLQASHDTRTDSSRLDWQYLPRRDVRSPFGGIVVERDGDDYGVGGNLAINDYRGELSARHDVDILRVGTGGSEREQRSSLRVGTSFVFADGHFGMSRPINDSFVLVARSPSVPETRILINSSSESSEGEIDFLGPAVLHDVVSYQVRSVRMSTPNLPFGYEIGRDLYYLEPPYRSGSVIELATTATVLLDGRLVDQAGESVGLVGGQAVKWGGEDDSKVTFFTNRKGRFRIDGLHPGRYELRFGLTGVKAAVVEIPDGTVGLYDIGTLRLGDVEK
jgi:outer membrane usher protein